MDELDRLMPRALQGRFEPLALLHDGAARQTLLLRSRTDGEDFVLKRSAEAGQLRSEARFLEELAGAGIPGRVRFFEEDGLGWLLREYVPGQTLLDYSQKKGPLGAAETVSLGLSLCGILKRLHGRERPVIHRDVKAENVILRPDGSLCLIDFGTARYFEREARQDTRALGTPGVAPPEQFGYRQTDPRSDVYAVGCLLHTLATGERDPAQGRTAPALERLIRRCLRFDPEKRYADAADLERALKRLTPGGRRRSLALAAALVLLLGALAGGLVLLGVNALAPEPRDRLADLTVRPETPIRPYHPPIPSSEGQDLPSEMVTQPPQWPAQSSAAPTEGTEAPPASTEAPTQASTEPSQPPTEPSQAAPTESSQAPTEPSQAPTEPSQPPTEPSQAPTEPRVVDGMYHFACPEIEKEVCRQLGREPGPVPEEELGRIETLMLCSVFYFMDSDGFSTNGKDVTLPYVGSLHSSERGMIDTVEDIPYLPNLKRLMLCRQQIRDISPLAGCGKLEWLVLHGNWITDISPLAGCTALRKLWIGDNQISDLSPLAAMSELEELHLDATPVRDLTPLRSLQGLTGLDLFDCPVETDLTPLRELRSLRSLKVFPMSAERVEVIGSLRSLRILFFWCTLEMKDLRSLSALTELEFLFVDLMVNCSCEGLEACHRLRAMQMVCDEPLDLSPVTALTGLEELYIYDLTAVSLEPLRELPNLRLIYCNSSQRPELERLLSDRQTELRVVR